MVGLLVTAPSADSSIFPRRYRKRSLGSADALSVVDCMLLGGTPTTQQLVTIRAQAGLSVCSLMFLQGVLGFQPLSWNMDWRKGRNYTKLG